MTLTPEKDIPLGLDFHHRHPHPRRYADRGDGRRHPDLHRHRPCNDTPTTAALSFMVTVNKGDQTGFAFTDTTVSKTIGEDSSTFTVTRHWVVRATARSLTNLTTPRSPLWTTAGK